MDIVDTEMFLFFFFSDLFIYLLYNIVLVLPYIDMNPPWVYELCAWVLNHSVVSDSSTLWTLAHQIPLSIWGCFSQAACVHGIPAGLTVDVSSDLRSGKHHFGRMVRWSRKALGFCWGEWTVQRFLNLLITSFELP